MLKIKMSSTATPNENVTEDISSNNGAEDIDVDDKPMSKRQMKKWEKRLVWQESRAERRKEEKERRKRKMEKYKAERGFIESRSASRKRLKKEQVLMSESACKVGVVFDMQFGSLMHQRDLGKCTKQILRCYSMNRRLKAPLQMYMTSLEGVVETEMSKHDGYRQWDMQFKSENFIDVLPKESLVYLSSDSKNSLETLEQGKNYIIGGLVDHNNHKGICLRKAQELGIQHARLPIDSYLEMKTRHVLAVNHVYEIMAQRTQNKSWKESFFTTIPSRKGAHAKSDDENVVVKMETVNPEIAGANCDNKHGGDVDENVGNALQMIMETY